MDAVLWDCDDELIATLSERSALQVPTSASQLTGHKLQSGIACRMAVGVIDLFEATKIDENDSPPSVHIAIVALVEGLKRCTVWKTSELVDEGREREFTY